MVPRFAAAVQLFAISGFASADIGEPAGLFGIAPYHAAQLVAGFDEKAHAAEAKARGRCGQARMALLVNPDGTVRDTEIFFAQPAKVFDGFLLSASREWRFQPLLLNGKASAFETYVNVTFALQSGCSGDPGSIYFWYYSPRPEWK